MLTHPLDDIPRDVSPDGRLVALDRTTIETSFDIWLVELNGPQTARPFAATPAAERFPAFSPNGRWIAYQSDESGRFEIYVRPADGTAGRWQISTDGGTEVRWSGTGREMFFRNGPQLLTVSATTEGLFSAGRPQLLFDDLAYRLSVIGTNYDVARDGQRFLMVNRELAPPLGFLNVITNWSPGREPIRQRRAPPDTP